MSNAEASKLYEAVIEEVISDSRQDFENSGIDESTLQDLKKLWCERLTHSGVAKFSWDVEEEAELHVAAAEEPVTVGAALDPASEVSVKHEPTDSFAPVNNDTNNHSSNNGLELPMAREENHIDTNGHATNIKLETPDINSDYNENNGLILPKVNQADGSFELTFYTDGSNDLMDKLKKKQQLLRRKIQKQQQSKEHDQTTQKPVSQVDGAVDDDDDDDDDIDDDDDVFNDSDDINSDLDDGLESEKSDDDDGDQEGQIMLCLYDKVQRVKNKWKSNLKEGIANIDGKDYVFQKATGESEW